jgi:hypothetical protein
MLVGRLAPGIAPCATANLGGGVEDSGRLVTVTVSYGEGFVGLKGVCTVVVHSLREAPHDGLYLTVDVPHRGIATTETHKPNVVHVNLSEEHIHGAACSQ